MTRRQLLVAAASAPVLSNLVKPEFARPLPLGRDPIEQMLLQIASGFLQNAAATSKTLAICNLPDGTQLAQSTNRNGDTFDSVSRMLPALAVWVNTPALPKAIRAGSTDYAIQDVLQRIYKGAFDPDQPSYWQPAPAGKPDQRQVEAALVAYSLWLAADKILPGLTSRQRQHIQSWLASCTQVPVRHTGWAWFTALNQAVRLGLSTRWREFSGDENSMQQDLAALDQFAVAGPDGWYDDGTNELVFDYSNFWIYQSYFLYWNRVVGGRYPRWSDRFRTRLQSFLRSAPYFFGANGSNVLYGRSLIYRWSVLTPLVQAYQQGLWPYSAGLLRRIVRGNLEFFWNAGAYDRVNGKLRESLTPTGSWNVREYYVDAAHPYWAMQAFSVLAIPRNDPFWMEREQPLPVETQSFVQRLEAEKMMLIGESASGTVRWLHVRNVHPEQQFKDKYGKFSYSSHFPFLVGRRNGPVWDSGLVFRSPQFDPVNAPTWFIDGWLLPNGYVRKWGTRSNGVLITITSTIQIHNDVEYRRHEIGAPTGTQVFEGSPAVGLQTDVGYTTAQIKRGQIIRSASTRQIVASRILGGHGKLVTQVWRDVHLLSPFTAINSLNASLSPSNYVLESIHLSTTLPLTDLELDRALQWPGNR